MSDDSIKDPAKRADPPHRLTLITAFGSLGVSLLSLAVSFGNASTSHQALIIGQKSYVNVYEQHAKGENGTGNRLLIRNFGNTPARVKIVSISGSIDPEKKTYTEDAFLSDHNEATLALAPKDEYEFANNTFTAEDKLERGTSVTAGKLRNTDVFGGTEDQQYCFFEDNSQQFQGRFFHCPDWFLPLLAPSIEKRWRESH